MVILAMEAELQAFDKRNKKPLPLLIQKWRNRWIKIINENAKVASLDDMEKHRRQSDVPAVSMHSSHIPDE